MIIHVLNENYKGRLKVNNSYRVQAIEFNIERPSVYYRIIADNGTPALFPFFDFEIRDTEMPSNWTVQVHGNTSINIQPDAWKAEGFWELYFDGDPEAVRIFDEHKSVDTDDVR